MDQVTLDLAGEWIAEIKRDLGVKLKEEVALEARSGGESGRGWRRGVVREERDPERAGGGRWGDSKHSCASQGCVAQGEPKRLLCFS